jgi:hypothetical protein
MNRYPWRQRTCFELSIHESNAAKQSDARMLASNVHHLQRRSRPFSAFPNSGSLEIPPRSKSSSGLDIARKRAEQDSRS